MGRFAWIYPHEEIPKGWRHATLAQAQQQKHFINQIIGDWGIVNMIDGKLDGTGYGNHITPSQGPESGAYLFIKGWFDHAFRSTHKCIDVGGSTESVAIIYKTEMLPCEASILTTEDAHALKHFLAKLLGDWDIVGLLNGKMDGKGYGNAITQKYPVAGHNLIMQGD